MTYEPRWDIDRADGEWGEWTVHALLRGDTVEVKSDREFQRTGNVYIEYRCKRRDGWKPSGLASTRADYWAFVLADGLVVIVETDSLKRAARQAWKDPDRRRTCPRGSHPTEGVLLTLTDLVEAVPGARWNKSA